MSAIDQQNQGPITAWINTSAGIGQQIAPTVAQLDSVQLTLRTIVPTIPIPVDVAINVRDTKIDGAIVATRNSVHIATSDDVVHPVTFTFAGATLTTGGHVYVLEIVTVNGPKSYIEVACTTPWPGKGDAVVGWALVPTFNLWFITNNG